MECLFSELLSLETRSVGWFSQEVKDAKPDIMEYRLHEVYSVNAEYRQTKRICMIAYLDISG